MTENANILTTPSVTPSRHQVVALAYDGLCTFEFGVAVEIFGLPRPEMGDNWYQFAVAAVDEGPLCATGGIRLMTDGGPELLAQADTIVVPGWRGVDAPVPEALCAALVAAHARGCRIISICSGVFVLAAAGLLNGRQATTHWRYTAALQSRFPQIQVVEDVLYVGDALLMTSMRQRGGDRPLSASGARGFRQRSRQRRRPPPGGLSPSRRRSDAAGPAPGSPQPGEPAPWAAV